MRQESKAGDFEILCVRRVIPTSGLRAERAIRGVTVSRKNSLFCVSEEGAAATFGLYSIIQTARENGLNPIGYIEFLLNAMPGLEHMSDIERALPWGDMVPDSIKAKPSE